MVNDSYGQWSFLLVTFFGNICVLWPYHTLLPDLISTHDLYVCYVTIIFKFLDSYWQWSFLLVTFFGNICVLWPYHTLLPDLISTHDLYVCYVTIIFKFLVSDGIGMIIYTLYFMFCKRMYMIIFRLLPSKPHKSIIFVIMLQIQNKLRCTYFV